MPAATEKLAGGCRASRGAGNGRAAKVGAEYSGRATRRWISATPRCRAGRSWWTSTTAFSSTDLILPDGPPRTRRRRNFRGSTTVKAPDGPSSARPHLVVAAACDWLGHRAVSLDRARGGCSADADRGPDSAITRRGNSVRSSQAKCSTRQPRTDLVLALAISWAKASEVAMKRPAVGLDGNLLLRDFHVIL